MCSRLQSLQKIPFLEASPFMVCNGLQLLSDTIISAAIEQIGSCNRSRGHSPCPQDYNFDIARAGKIMGLWQAWQMIVETAAAPRLRAYAAGSAAATPSGSDTGGTPTPDNSWGCAKHPNTASQNTFKHQPFMRKYRSTSTVWLQRDRPAGAPIAGSARLAQQNQNQARCVIVGLQRPIVRER